MRTIPDSEPIFATIPDSPEERLELVKQFAQRWSGDPVVPPRGIAKRIQAAEGRLDVALSPILRSFYESGLRKWFATHGHKEFAQYWPDVNELNWHERTGALRILGRHPMFSIKKPDTATPDPLVYEMKEMGQHADPPFRLVIGPAVALSEMLIREVLMTASDVVRSKRQLKLIHQDGLGNRDIRRELTRVPVNGLKDGISWRFYERGDVVFQETDPNVHRGPSYVAALVGQSAAVLQPFRKLKNPPQVNWGRVERVLTDGSETALRAFLEQHPIENLCAVGYVFELWNASPAFDLCANTRLYYQQQIEMYRSQDPELHEDRIRWNSGEYEYPTLLGECELGPEWEAEYAFLDELSNEEDDRFGIKDGLINVGCRALATLARRGLFGDCSKIDFNVASVDCDVESVKSRNEFIQHLIQSG